MTAPRYRAERGAPWLGPAEARVAAGLRGPARGLLAMIAVLPDTEAYARDLDEPELTGLLGAFETYDGWRVDRRFLPALRARGLADYCAPFLTVFGVDVRRAAMRGDG